MRSLRSLVSCLYKSPSKLNSTITMMLIMCAFAIMQSLVVASAIDADSLSSADFAEMALAVQDPSNVLAIPKRASLQAIVPDFVSSDSTYWMVEYTYSGASCDSRVVMKNGLATGYCIRTGVSSSAKYACTSVSSCTVLVFSSDTTCASATPVVYNFNLGVCNTADADDDGYLTDDGALFAKMQAVAVQGYPTAFSDGPSGLHTAYNSQTCAQSSMYSYQGGYENHCYSNYDGVHNTSSKYTNPNMVSYTGAGCIPANVVSTDSVPSGVCQIDSATSSSKTVFYDNSDKNALSAGAIAGIVIGSLAGVAILAALLYFFVFHRAKVPLGQQSASVNNV